MAAAPARDPNYKFKPEGDGVTFLLVDDEEEFLISTKENLEMDSSVTVETAESPEEGIEKMKAKTGDGFDAMVWDRNFENSSTKGDEALWENHDLIGHAEVHVITGHTDYQSENRKKLKEIGIEVQNRDSDGWRESLQRIIDKNRESYLVKVNERLAGLGTIFLNGGKPHLENEIKGLFLDWLEGVPDQEKKFFLVGQNALNANELYEQVESEPQVGERVMKMFLREIKYSLNQDEN